MHAWIMRHQLHWKLWISQNIEISSSLLSTPTERRRNRYSICFLMNNTWEGVGRGCGGMRHLFWLADVLIRICFDLRAWMEKNQALSLSFSQPGYLLHSLQDESWIQRTPKGLILRFFVWRRIFKLNSWKQATFHQSLFIQTTIIWDTIRHSDLRHLSNNQCNVRRADTTTHSKYRVNCSGSKYTALVCTRASGHLAGST